MEILATIFVEKLTALVVISTFNIWLLLAVLTGMLFIAFVFYKSKFNSIINTNDELERQITGLQQQLDYASRLEIKARAESERSAAARDKLLTSVSHEIRTPMNGILGMAILLEETPLKPDQQDYVDTIISSGKILLNKVNEVMANDMLDHSKIEVVNTAPQQKTLDLRNSIEEVLATFAVKASEGGLDLLYEIDADVPMQVLGDSKRLQQVLLNLVENVIDTATQQEVFIGLHLIKDETTNEPVLGFEIGNKRIGDAAEMRQQLSAGNELSDYSLEDEQETEALGLAISKKLVEEMGGEIRTVKEEAVSQHFMLKIPLTEAVLSSKTSAGYSMKGFEQERILIINANKTASDILKNQLEQWKLSPVVAYSGGQALELLSKGSFSMLITEIDMPDINGTEMLKQIRNQYPNLSVLLLNPLNDERHKQDETVFGEIAVLSKPVRQHLLFDNILTTLRQIKKGNAAQEISVKNLSTDFSKQYPLRILIAEDNPVNQKWATKILSKMGYQPDIAENGHVALEMVGQTAYDLVLMDVQMPEMDGIEATKMIRVCLSKQPVVIAMTANVMHGDRQACMQAGMDDYISKPVNLSDLVNMLEKWALVIRERKLA